MSGPFHVASPRPPDSWGDLLDDTAAAVAAEGTRLVWVDPEFAREQGLDGRSLPLWHEGGEDGAGAVDPSPAVAQGLSPRPVADSARDVLHQEAGTRLVDGVGLAQGREAELLPRWRSRA